MLIIQHASSTRNPTAPTIHPRIGTIHTNERQNQQIARPMHWKQWKRMKGFVLYGAITRKMIAGMMVTYASAPAAVSLNPSAGAAAADSSAVAEVSVASP